MTSDHFNPWSERQGHSAATWTWLGSALQATNKIGFGSLAIPGGWCYHPALLAQSIATLCEMYPKRLEWIALGSGQALNEHVVGRGWPVKAERRRSLAEGIRIMRALLNGETVHQPDGLIPVEDARLWTRPKSIPQFIAASLSESTAQWAGGWADGLVTINQSVEKLKPIMEAFRENGGDGKPLTLQIHLSWDESDELARKAAHHQWRSNACDPQTSQEKPDPADFDRLSETVSLEDMDQFVLISSNPERHRDWLQSFLDLGFDQLVLHNVGRNQERFIETFSSEVIPQLSKS